MTIETGVDLDAENTRLRNALRRERRARAHRFEINRIAAETSSQVTRRGVAEVIALNASDIFGSHWVMVAFVGDDDMIQFVHGPGVPDDVARDWATASLDVITPISDVLRGDLAGCSLSDPEQFAPWPILIAEAGRAEVGSLHVEAIAGDDRPNAVIALAWQEPHALDDDERQLLDEMVVSAAPAFARAVRTEVDRDVATTLQTWLLPEELPTVPGLEIATVYEPGKVAMEVGGDWYDVVTIDDTRTSIVVGDVVGHDARAAAEMGQVRHVLASHLLATADPVASLELADHYFSRRASDTMATALVMVYDSDTALLELASAGHLPPVVAELGASTRSIDSGLGPPVGSGLGGYSSLTRTFPPHALLVAFTDGVVEVRDETLDDGLAQFCGALDHAIATSQAGTSRDVPLLAIIDLLVDRAREPWRTDDAAAVVLRAK